MTATTVTNMRTSRIVKLIETVVTEGEGTRDDPCRLVTYYTTLGGHPLLTDDSYGIRAPRGIGKDGLFPEDRHPTAKHYYVAQPDGTLMREEKP